MASLTDPVTACQLQEHRAIEPARCPVIDVLNGGRMAQLGGLGSALEALLMAQRTLALEENGEPLRMTQRLGLRIVRHVPEAVLHAVQSEVA
jgi:hypothetical protein